jgi:hypothetical protein
MAWRNSLRLAFSAAGHGIGEGAQHGFRAAPNAGLLEPIGLPPQVGFDLVQACEQGLQVAQDGLGRTPRLGAHQPSEAREHHGVKPVGLAQHGDAPGEAADPGGVNDRYRHAGGHQLMSGKLVIGGGRLQNGMDACRPYAGELLGPSDQALDPVRGVREGTPAQHSARILGHGRAIQLVLRHVDPKELHPMIPSDEVCRGADQPCRSRLAPRSEGLRYRPVSSRAPLAGSGAPSTSQALGLT